jgi:predicted transposase YbfD/YdcC
VENQLHGTLDVCFNEDQCRVRIANAAYDRDYLLTLLGFRPDTGHAAP